MLKKLKNMKKWLLLLMILVLIQTFAYEFYLIKAQVEASERSIESFRSTHESQASLAFLLEDQISSIYYRLTLDQTLGEWLQQREPTISNMYLLGLLQDNSLKIISSNPLVVSVYIYGKTTDTVLSTNHEFTKLDQFPDKEIFTEFNEKNGHWVGKRLEKAGYGNAKSIISFIGAIGNNGLVAINIDERKLLSQSADLYGTLLVGKERNILTFQDGKEVKIPELPVERLPQKPTLLDQPFSLEGYKVFQTGRASGEWEMISIATPIESSPAWQSRKIMIVVLSLFLIMLAAFIYRYVKKSYFQPIERLEHNYSRNLDDLKHNFVLNVLTGKLKEADIREKMTEMGVQFPSERIMVIVFQIDDFYDYLLNMKQDDRFFMDKTIYNAIKWTFMTTYASYVVKAELEKIAILLSIPGDMDEAGMLHKVEGTIRYLQNEIRDNCNLTICAGISRLQESLKDAHTGYYQALQAVGFKTIYGKHSIIRYQDISAKHSDEHVYLVTDINKMCNLIKEDRLDEFESLFRRMQNGMLNEEKFSLDRLNALFSNVLYGIVKLTLEQRFDFADIVKEDIFMKIYSYEFLQDKTDYVIHVARTVSAAIQARKNSNNKTVQLILDYIHDHYDQSISLTTISDSLGINSSYISTLIKQEVGQGFVDYMNQLRINKAQNLLQDPNLTIKHISEICGYETVHSFIRNFKKVHLLTPSEYRNKSLSKRNV